MNSSGWFGIFEKISTLYSMMIIGIGGGFGMAWETSGGSVDNLSLKPLLSYFFKKITLSRGLWYARMGLYVTPIRLGLLSTPNQITDSKCVSSE